MTKHIPKRMCVACRQMINQNELFRVVKNNDEIIIDNEKKKFGRGAYVCKNEKCIKLAMKKKAFERHLKVSHDIEIYESLAGCLNG